MGSGGVAPGNPDYQLHAPAALSPEEGAFGTRWMGGLVGPRNGLELGDEDKGPCSYRKSNPSPPARDQSLYSQLYLLKLCLK